MTTQIDDKYFSESNEIKSSFIKWGAIGDWIKATLLDKREIDSTFNIGEKVVIYDLKIHGGSFHDMDESKQPIEPPIVLEEGQLYSMSGKAGIDNQMRNVRKGQIFGAKFVSTFPSKTKGFAPAKSVKIYTDGTMDQSWLDENKSVDDQIKDDVKPF